MVKWLEEGMIDGIDYVFPWVDMDNDADLRAAYASSVGGEMSRCRLSSWGGDRQLRCVLRALAANLPWVRKVHLLVRSESSVPTWIDRDAVHIVPHADFIPARFLPTFNSCTIEMFLNAIPGLSERFIYGNDDMYFLRPCFPDDFFEPCGRPILRIYARRIADQSHVPRRGVACISDRGQAICALAGAARFLAWRIRPAHWPTPLTRAAIADLQDRLGEALGATITRVRSARNVSYWMWADWLAMANIARCVPQHVPVFRDGEEVPFGLCRVMPDEDACADICSLITRRSACVICVNDGRQTWLDGVPKVLDTFESLYREPCRFERVENGGQK